MSKKKELSSAQNVQRTLQQLVLKHSVLMDRKPLALLIHLQIRDAHPELTKTQIRRALRWFVNSKRYIQALAAGGARYDLSGAENGAVADEHQQSAKQRLKLMQTVKRKPKPAQATANAKPDPKITIIDAEPEAKEKPQPKIVVKRRRIIPASADNAGIVSGTGKSA